MQTRILGTTMPVLEVQLDPNESVFSESGELSWMTASIQMTTHTQMGGGGGFFGVLKRAAAGASIFMTEYRAIQYHRLGLVCHAGCPATSCLSSSARGRSTWCTGTAFCAPRPR